MRVTSSKTLDRPHYGRPSLKGAVLLCLFACLVVSVSTVAEVDLSKLDTEDSKQIVSNSSADPKVTYPKLVAKAFPKKYKPINKKQATKFMIEHYTGVCRSQDDISIQRLL